MKLNVALMIYQVIQKILRISGYVISITSSLSSRGHKPAKGKSSSKSRSDTQRGILKVNLCVVICSQCSNEVCLSSDIPCKTNKTRVFDKLFTVACNFLDEQNGNKTILHNALYTCISTEPCNGSMVPYICMSCQPFFLKSVKIEAEYKEAKTMFQEKQGCSNPSSWSDLAKEHEQVQDEYDHSIPRSNYAVDEGIFSEGLKEPLKEAAALQ